jgi:hypothetical protein
MKKIELMALTCMIVLGTKMAYGQTSIAIEAVDVVSTNESKNVFVAVAQTGTTNTIVVEMGCRQGSGEACFLPSGGATTNISQSTTLVIRGKILSNTEKNMIIIAKAGENVFTTNVFTVVDTNKIGFAQAQTLAVRAIAGIVQPEDGAPVTVELVDGGSEYLVTFENVYEEGVLKGDYSAQVRIGASNGSVLGIMSGP